MGFVLSDEQKAVQKLVREFVEKNIAPTVKERDEKCIFDRKITDGLYEIGVQGLFHDKKYGGGGGLVQTYAVALEEVCRYDIGIAAASSVTSCLYAWPTWYYGTEEQKERFLRPILTGPKLGSFGLTEPNAGSDAAMQQTVAVKDGNNYIINGSKKFITNAGECDFILVFCMTDQSKGVKGISCFLVERDTPGLSFGRPELKMGINTSMQREVYFNDMKVSKNQLLGEEGIGFRIAMKTLDLGRISVATQGVGLGHAALEYAIKYTKERVQFGRPIASNQGLQFMMADMQNLVDTSRLLLWRAAYNMDHGLPYALEASQAKLFATDAAMKIATDTVQLYGGYGFIKDFPVERLMRDAKIAQIYEGTNQIQRMVIAGQILR
jgi:alkylation response protein AidB-like acyl-CoA dehydrogenase